MFPILLGKTKDLEAKCADLQRQIDEGGGGGSTTEPLIITLSEESDGIYGNKNYNQIKAAFLEGKNIIIIKEENEYQDKMYGTMKALYQTKPDEPSDPITYYVLVSVGSDSYDLYETDPNKNIKYTW